jgi:type I restriction enzyme M protein
MRAADLMVSEGLRKYEAGEPVGEEANMAKMLAAEASWAAGEACIQTHGGFGFAAEYDIERKFRIVAVVSLPQTTFTHTGAGVKSSVLFLKKHPQAITDSIKSTQDTIKEQVAQALKLEATYKQWEAEKREALKPLLKLKDEASQAKKDEINEQFSEKWNNLYDETAESYTQRKQAALQNYPIFMAIAENIGYDAAGKTIAQNDLPDITAELKRFIESIEKGDRSANFR